MWLVLVSTLENNQVRHNLSNRQMQILEKCTRKASNLYLVVLVQAGERSNHFFPQSKLELSKLVFSLRN